MFEPCFLIGSGGGITLAMTYGSVEEARRFGDNLASEYPGFTYRIGTFSDTAPPKRDDRDRFLEHLDRASKHVAAMPEWKQNILGKCASPTVDVPRQPISDVDLY